MKFSLLLTALMFSWSAGAQASSASICDRQLKSTHPVFQTALNNLHSFTYVRKALESASHGLENPVLCTSMVALAINAYGYYQYFIDVEVMASAQQPAKRFHFVFQDASVQAFHNVGGQPWVGLDPGFVRNTAEQWIDHSRFVNLVSNPGSDDWKSLAQKTKTYQSHAAILNADTVSAVALPSSTAGGQVHLVTWMTTQQGSNPFSSPLITQGVLLRFNADRSVDVVENVFPMSDWLFPLEDNAQSLERSLPEDRNLWAEKLLSLSQIQP